MQENWNNLEEDKYDEEWLVILQSGGEYSLSKKQAWILRQAIAENKRQVMFETFLIPIPYIVEFRRVRRFLKESFQLSERTEEEEYIPIPTEKWEKIRKETLDKIKAF